MSDNIQQLMDFPAITLGSISSFELKLRDPPETKADRLAAAHWLSNRAGLATYQPELAQKLEAITPAVEWVFGREGYLTGRDAGGWWAGCSVPLVAGREMLKKLELAGIVGCFLNPTHAGQLRACFERIQPTRAIVAVIPDLMGLAILLRCDDFSQEMRAGRLMFAAGWDWAAQLGQVFREHTGLPMPQQFVRVAILDDIQLARYSAEAEPVIAAETGWRSERISRLRAARDRRVTSTHRVLVVARSGFRFPTWPELAFPRGF